MGQDLLPPAPLRLGGEPLPMVGPVRLYVCGVTPYDVTHLGHAATFVWVDALVRTLRAANMQPLVTRNVTDVDDVLTEAARRAGAPYDEYAAIHQYAFDHDMSELGVRRPDHEPRAHQHIGDVIRLAQALLDRGAAYEVAGTVYFKGAAVPAAAGVDEPSAREQLVEFGEQPDDPAKESPYDVPVWRASAGSDPAWPSPWGLGRPGWHAECTAMVLSHYGSSLDIHAGGADLAFPHHAYESAQAEAATGVAPFARAWMRVGTVRIGGEKMAKSTGNLVLVADLLKEHRPGALRLMILDRHWSDAWDYAPESLTAAEGRLDSLRAAAGRPGDSEAAEREVLERLLDDVDVPGALAVALESGCRPARVLVQVLGLS
ncbi:MAG: cysteine--tRNA ligase [Actinomycetota bacterium]